LQGHTTSAASPTVESVNACIPPAESPSDVADNDPVIVASRRRRRSALDSPTGPDSASPASGADVPALSLQPVEAKRVPRRTLRRLSDCVQLPDQLAMFGGGPSSSSPARESKRDNSSPDSAVPTVPVAMSLTPDLPASLTSCSGAPCKDSKEPSAVSVTSAPAIVSSAVDAGSAANPLPESKRDTRRVLARLGDEQAGTSAAIRQRDRATLGIPCTREEY
jgi:hypothetical protein